MHRKGVNNMKFDWFEILKYLEKHAKNDDEFNKKLLTLTQQEAADLWVEVNQKTVNRRQPLM